MSDAQIYLWPLFGFFLIAAAGAAWQWRTPREEAAARERLLAGNLRTPRWRGLPQWERYWSQQVLGSGEYETQGLNVQRIAHNSRLESFDTNLLDLRRDGGKGNKESSGVSSHPYPEKVYEY